MYFGKSNFGLGIFFFILVFTLFFAICAGAQTKPVRLSIASGPTGANYYAQAGAMAQIISKSIPNTEATAEATNASVDNCKLVHLRKAELGMATTDICYDAFRGQEKFKSLGPMPLRAVTVLYPFYNHFVTTQWTNINSVVDLRGKRVAVGAPGSGTEVTSKRVMESYGINFEKDIKKQNLHGVQAVDALKDRKIDALTWVVGVPTAGLLDLAATPGVTMKILNNTDHLDKLNQKYGPCYTKGIIPKATYPNMSSEANVVSILTILMCHESMDAVLVYNILKTLFNHQTELATFHRDFTFFTLTNAVIGASLPFHPGAVKYFQENGIKVE